MSFSLTSTPSTRRKKRMRINNPVAITRCEKKGGSLYKMCTTLTTRAIGEAMSLGVSHNLDREHCGSVVCQLILIQDHLIKEVDALLLP